MKLTHAMILAAGLGTRMRPLTNELPKPLIPVAGKPLIDWCLDWLAEGGIQQVVINSSYRAAQLEAHVGARAVISREGEPPLETGGGVKKALPLLGVQPFLTMNSDAIFMGENPIPMLNRHWSREADFLMLLVPKSRAIGWHGKGDFVFDGGAIRQPYEGEEADYMFTGVQVMHPSVFEGTPDGAFSYWKLWNERRGPDGWFQRMEAVVFDGDWLNVGDLPGLATAEAYLASMGARI